MQAKAVSFDDWQKLSEGAHKVTFGEDRSKDFNTYDYCVAAFNDADEICGYATIIEMDASWAYMQHGGAFPNISKTVSVGRAYKEMVEFLKKHYSIISTKIENKNQPMLKLAMANGFEINGVDYICNKVIVHLMMEVH